MTWTFVGAASGFPTVGLGRFGAHGLEKVGTLEAAVGIPTHVREGAGVRAATWARS